MMKRSSTGHRIGIDIMGRKLHVKLKTNLRGKIWLHKTDFVASRQARGEELRIVLRQTGKKWTIY